MSFEWSEKEKKYTMFAEDEMEDAEEKFNPNTKKGKKKIETSLVIGLDEKKDIKCTGNKNNQ